MSESTVTTRRWKAYVCPECRSVFRVDRDHDGRGIVCPECQRVLRLPENDESTPPLTLQTQELPKKSSSSSDRRRQRQKDVFDETFSNKKQGTDRTVARIVIAASLTLLAVLLVGVFWPRSQANNDTEAMELQALENEFAQLTDETTPEKEIPIEPLDRNLISLELEPVLKGFMNAASLEEASEFIRHPEVSRPKMKKYYAEGYQAPGYRSIQWNARMGRQGQWAALVVQDKDYNPYAAALALEDGRWKVDWEAFVGWGEMTWSELREQRPTSPVLVRAFLEATDYYNFSFSSDSEWTSYALSNPSKDSTLYGYVPSLGELDQRLRPNRHEKQLRYTLRVRFPEQPESDNQVIIEEVVSKFWHNKDE